MPDPVIWKASLTINNVSFNDWIKENGIRYSVAERVVKTIVTMDGTKHERKILKDILEVDLFDMPDSELYLVESALSSASPALVSYTTKSGLSRSSVPFYVTSSISPTAKTVIGNSTYFTGLSFTIEEK